MAPQRKLRMAMVGGGPGAFIGDVHRKAVGIDGQIELVAGCFDIDPKKSQQMGQQLFLDKSRVYDTVADMLKNETSLPADKRVDFVTITTPNNSHFPIAKACLEAGFHVYCEKPMTMDLAQAKELKTIVRKTKKVFGLNHNYTGYPMVKLARDMVAQGDLGEIMRIVVEYPQGWLVQPIDAEGQQQAAWRTDPKQAGISSCIGDIGTHAENLSEYITGLKIREVCADLTTFVKGRRLEDDGSCLLRFNNGARGVLMASQISIGEENGLAIRVYGRKRSLEWHQEHPNYLYVRPLSGPVEVWRRGNDYIAAKSPAAAHATRLPAGHPEAFLEAMANLYANFADTIRSHDEGKKPSPLAADFPTVDDGLRGMQFIETVVASSKSKQKWTKYIK